VVRVRPRHYTAAHVSISLKFLPMLHCSARVQTYAIAPRVVSLSRR